VPCFELADCYYGMNLRITVCVIFYLLFDERYFASTTLIKALHNTGILSLPTMVKNIKNTE
jgi:hypothetical protein